MEDKRHQLIFFFKKDIVLQQTYLHHCSKKGVKIQYIVHSFSMHSCIQVDINGLEEYLHESTCKALVIDKQILTQEKSYCFGVE